MEPLRPEQATFLLQLYLVMLKNEYPLTKKVIEAIPPDRGDYRPDSSSRTALDLAWHIVSAENRFLNAVVSGEFNYGGSSRPDSVQDSADVARWYTELYDVNLNRLMQLSSDQLLKVIDFRGVFRFPAIVYLQFALNHSIHHRGQLSTYLRPMGAKVPSIYGESFDDAQVRKSAQSQTSLP